MNILLANSKYKEYFELNTSKYGDQIPIYIRKPELPKILTDFPVIF